MYFVKSLIMIGVVLPQPDRERLYVVVTFAEATYSVRHRQRQSCFKDRWILGLFYLLGDYRRE